MICHRLYLYAIFWFINVIAKNNKAILSKSFIKMQNSKFESSFGIFLVPTYFSLDLLAFQQISDSLR